jgi:hypothetical protein
MPKANRSLNQIVGGFLAAWFFFALTIGVARSFRSASPGAVTVTVWGLSAFALFACWKIPIFRDFVAAVDLRRLVAIYLIRFVGIYFLILGASGRLPPGFARPAGVGDIIIACGAVVLVAAPWLRSWQTILRI